MLNYPEVRKYVPFIFNSLIPLGDREDWLEKKGNEIRIEYI